MYRPRDAVYRRGVEVVRRVLGDELPELVVQLSLDLPGGRRDEGREVFVGNAVRPSVREDVGEHVLRPVRDLPLVAVASRVVPAVVLREGGEPVHDAVVDRRVRRAVLDRSEHRDDAGVPGPDDSRDGEREKRRRQVPQRAVERRVREPLDETLVLPGKRPVEVAEISPEDALEDSLRGHRELREELLDRFVEPAELLPSLLAEVQVETAVARLRVRGIHARVGRQPPEGERVPRLHFRDRGVLADEGEPPDVSRADQLQERSEVRRRPPRLLLVVPRERGRIVDVVLELLPPLVVPRLEPVVGEEVGGELRQTPRDHLDHHGDPDHHLSEHARPATPVELALLGGRGVPAEEDVLEDRTAACLPRAARPLPREEERVHEAPEARGRPGVTERVDAADLGVDVAGVLPEVSHRVERLASLRRLGPQLHAELGDRGELRGV